METRETRERRGEKRKVEWKCKEGVRLSKSVVFGPNKNRENRKLSSSRGRQTFSLETLFRSLFPSNPIHARPSLEGSSIFGIRS